MRLLVNADDYGLSKGASLGIIKSMKEGIVRDTSILVNSPNFKECVAIAKENGINEMGIHLTLSFQKPVLSSSEVKTIVDEQGNFYRRITEVQKNFLISEVEKELRAQMDKFSESGLKLNHIDGHHHFYVYNDDIYNLVIELAKEYNVPMRSCGHLFNDKLSSNGVESTDYFYGEFYDEKVNEDTIINILEKHKDEDCTLEIMSHPAIVDDDLVKFTTYSYKRDKELSVLTSRRLLNYINENNIELISFNAI